MVGGVCEYAGIGFGCAGIEGCDHAVEVVFAAQTFLAELVGDDSSPHYGVGVAEEVYAVAAAAQFAQSLQSLHGYAYDKFLECVVNLVVGHAFG